MGTSTNPVNGDNSDGRNLRRKFPITISPILVNTVLSHSRNLIAVRQDTKKYYQVTWSMMEESVKARELAPLIAIDDNYEKVILSMDKTYVTDHEGIRFQNIIDFLLEE
jgi:predicted AAA+ superfamily ATPase